MTAPSQAPDVAFIPIPVIPSEPTTATKEQPTITTSNGNTNDEQDSTFIPIPVIPFDDEDESMEQPTLNPSNDEEDKEQPTATNNHTTTGNNSNSESQNDDDYNPRTIDLLISTAYMEIDNLPDSPNVARRSSCQECENRTGLPPQPPFSYGNNDANVTANNSSNTTCAYRRGLLPTDTCFRGGDGYVSMHYFANNHTNVDIFFSDAECQNETRRRTYFLDNACSSVDTQFHRAVLPEHCIQASLPQGEYQYPLVSLLVYTSQELCEADQGNVNPSWYLLEPNFCFETLRWSGIVQDNVGEKDATAVQGGYLASCEISSTDTEAIHTNDTGTLVLEAFSDASCQRQDGIDDSNWTQAKITATCSYVEGINPWNPYLRAPNCLTPTIFCKSLNGPH